MTNRERTEFKSYLRACTDRQVQGVWDTENAARRFDYRALAEQEAARRGIKLDRGQ